MIVSFQEVVLAEFSVTGLTHKGDIPTFRERRYSPVHTPAGPHRLRYGTAEPELQESQTSIS